MLKYTKLLPLSALLYVLPLSVSGQGSFHNFGNLRIHDKGSLGFHSDLINDGIFDKNEGLVGFYQDTQLKISGAFSPTFYDFETAVEKDLYLEVPITIANSVNFVYGNIKSTRNEKSVYIQLLRKAYHNGANDNSKVDGYTAVDGQKEFSFPVGYDHKIRPLNVRFVDGSFFAKCEYFYENPNNPDSFYQSFDINKMDPELYALNSKEFWNLSTSGVLQITLSWDSQSDLSSIVKDLSNVVVAGWNKKDEQWENLGNALLEGNLTTGTVTSNTFNANNYEIFTIGSFFDKNDNTPGNYALSPNGDGINDALIFEITRKSPKNNLKIFDRSGHKVYEKSDYQDEFVGKANKGASSSVYDILPNGVYFYLLELLDLNMKHQGYFYITR